MKKIINILIWFFVVATIFAGMGFATISNDKQVCTDLTINIEQLSGNHFVNKKDVEALIFEKNGIQIGKKLSDINSKLMEVSIQNNPYIKNTEVYKTGNGKLKIDIKQRKPIVRVITKDDSSFYIDEDFSIMPLSNKYTSRVLLVNGKISDNTVKMAIEKDNTIKLKYKLGKIALLADFITKDKFLNAQIEQIYINENNEFELVPKVGTHIILLGDVSNLDAKFKRLKLFYKKGIPKVGWDRYKLVNIKFENQVVCTLK